MPLHILLLVEDNPDEAELARRIIHKYDATIAVVPYETGEGALEFLRRENITLPDLILLDLKLPLMSGQVFLQHMRGVKGCAVIPVIILTGYEEAMRDMASSYDVQGYLLKPLTAEDWRECLHKLRLDI